MAKRKRFTSEQIILKLREAEVLLRQKKNDQGSMSDAGDFRANLLSRAERVWEHEYQLGQKTKHAGKGKHPTDGVPMPCGKTIVAELSLDNVILK